MTVPVAAVVHATGVWVALWHVDVRATPLTVGRNTGAWVIGSGDLPTLRLLVTQRYILATQQGAGLIAQCRAETPGAIDMPATLSAATTDIRRQREAFTTELARKPNLVEPDWVSFEPCPTPLDQPDPANGALVVANWLGGACDTWRRMEDQRLVRPNLRALAGSSARPLPLVVR